MTELVIDIPMIVENLKDVRELVHKSGKSLTLVSKLFGSNPRLLRHFARLGQTQIADTVPEHLLRVGKRYSTMWLKASPSSLARYWGKFDYIAISDPNLLLSPELNGLDRQKVYLNLELGDLRDGLPLEELVEWVPLVRAVPNVELVGVASNLGCLLGKTLDNGTLDRLHFYLQEAFVNQGLPLPRVSLGGTVIFDELADGSLPDWVTDLRIGEAVYFGNNMTKGKSIPTLHQQGWRLRAELLEVKVKSPDSKSVVGLNAFGQKTAAGKTEPHLRGVLDFGELIAPVNSLVPQDSNVKIVGSSHDHVVVDLSSSQTVYKTGDIVEFLCNYNAVATAFPHRFVKKTVISKTEFL